MSGCGFSLVPVQTGGAPVLLPPGETVLGRGPLLGISDKRVSRHHGLLENLDGQLRLKPTHLNPCFLLSGPDDEKPRPLQRDCWHPLRHGDVFSLLPGQLVFRVAAEGGDERTPRNSQAIEEEAEEEGKEEEEKQELPASPESHVEPTNPVREDPVEAVTSSAPSNKEEDRRETQGNDASPVTKKRVLPAWMTKTAAAPAPASSPKAVKKTKTPAAAAKATPTAAEGAGLSQEKRPRKRRRRRRSEEEEEEEEEEEAAPKTARKGRQQQPVPVRSEVSEESDNVTMEMEEEEEEREVGVRGQTSDAGAASKPKGRLPCPYGKDCYRKNPLHFQECSHPGDGDYQEEGENGEEGEEAELPECPYGTDCYRKNPLHRKEFKHSKRPARSTRAVAKRSRADEDEEDDDDDDSFINDDSEDGDNDEDKDYVPPDSDDSGTEDVKRLQREAQDFLRRRK